MIDLHEKNTEKKVETAVADSKYGTIDNFLLCHDLNIKAHMPSIEETHRGSGRQKGVFPKELFSYNPDTDTFICPAGKVLKKRHYHKKRNHFEYKASPQDCLQCNLRDQCTRAKDGRTLKRHARKDELDIMLDEAKSRQAKKDLVQRKHLSERSFAKSTRYGFKRAKWRSLWRMEIQDYLIAAIENIMILIEQPKKQMSKSNVRTEGVRKNHEKHTLWGFIQAVVRSFFELSAVSLKMA
jgi:hypothetical protein